MITDLDTFVDRIPDGASVAVAPDYSGCAMAAVRALIRRGARDLHLIAVPQAGFQADMLIGAGWVASVETAAITLGEHGFAPRFGEAVKNGDIVHAVNGMPLTSADGAMSAYQALMSESNFTFDVTRRNQKKTFNYEIR